LTATDENPRLKTTLELKAASACSTPFRHLHTSHLSTHAGDTSPKYLLPHGENYKRNKYVDTSVRDPDPHSDPDPYVFGPPGSASGSVIHKYGSGSGFFHHQAKIERKTLISTVL